ncbi:DUF4334 domain-containing protein [Gemmatimonas sp.]|uniref:DUF4334 domain-containing protein n=1 Tax=Gemmatimonas sp. TaxID=1962908 RepID=UPI0035688351
MTLAETLARFDAMPVVTTLEILGQWRGSGVPTGHDMDGLLEAYAWYGKSFVSEEVVHPLLFRNRAGETYAIDPRRIPLALSRFHALTRNAGARALFALATPLFRTRAPRARLRAVTHRGVTTAAMVYDHLPIIDYFRRVDARTLLGLMDLRGSAPFFFQLERDA